MDRAVWNPCANVGASKKLLAFAIVLGAIVGSFLNVCIYRLPKGESVVFPGSHCMACRTPIKWYDNVPVLSYLLLRGKCRHCHAKYSSQYLIVEILTAFLFGLFYLTFGFTVKGVIYLVLALGLVVESFIDLEHRIIPDEISLSGIVLGLLLSTIFPSLQNETVFWKGFLLSLLGLLVGGGFLYGSAMIAEWFLKQEAMGGGDIKLLAAIGAFLGWKGAIWTIFVSSIIGSIVGVYQKIRHGEQHIPYGPYLALAAVLYLFIGPGIYDWYFKFYQ